jgi:hypothetical protein
MREGYGLIRDLYRHAWLQENRPYWLDNVMANYDLEMQSWIQRGTRFSEASAQYRQTHALPKPQDMGLPMLPEATPPARKDLPAVHADK